MGDIESFAGYTRFLILVTRKSRELIVLASELECRSSQTWPGRVIGADDERDDLTLLSEGIKNSVLDLWSAAIAKYVVYPC